MSIICEFNMGLVNVLSQLEINQKSHRSDTGITANCHELSRKEIKNVEKLIDFSILVPFIHHNGKDFFQFTLPKHLKLVNFTSRTYILP